MLEAEELRCRGPQACLGSLPLVLEIGFGRAELLLELAQAEPKRAFLGLEVSRKRAHKAARRAARRGIENLRIVHSPAEYVLERALPEACVDLCWINFSDPWPKKRHHKRRLIQPRLLAQLARVLAPGAILHVATDHAPYARWIHEVLSGQPLLARMGPPPWSEHPPERRVTAYESSWLAEGRRIAYFEYQRT